MSLNRRIVEVVEWLKGELSDGLMVWRNAIVTTAPWRQRLPLYPRFLHVVVLFVQLSLPSDVAKLPGRKDPQETGFFPRPCSFPLLVHGPFCVVDSAWAEVYSDGIG